MCCFGFSQGFRCVGMLPCATIANIYIYIYISLSLSLLLLFMYSFIYVFIQLFAYLPLSLYIRFITHSFMCCLFTLVFVLIFLHL